MGFRHGLLALTTLVLFSSAVQSVGVTTEEPLGPVAAASDGCPFVVREGSAEWEEAKKPGNPNDPKDPDEPGWPLEPDGGSGEPSDVPEEPTDPEDPPEEPKDPENPPEEPPGNDTPPLPPMPPMPSGVRLDWVDDIYTAGLVQSYRLYRYISIDPDTGDVHINGTAIGSTTNTTFLDVDTVQDWVYVYLIVPYTSCGAGIPRPVNYPYSNCAGAVVGLQPPTVYGIYASGGCWAPSPVPGVIPCPPYNVVVPTDGSKPPLPGVYTNCLVQL